MGIMIIITALQHLNVFRVSGKCTLSLEMNGWMDGWMDGYKTE